MNGNMIVMGATQSSSDYVENYYMAVELNPHHVQKLVAWSNDVIRYAGKTDGFVSSKFVFDKNHVPGPIMYGTPSYNAGLEPVFDAVIEGDAETFTETGNLLGVECQKKCNGLDVFIEWDMVRFQTYTYTKHFGSDSLYITISLNQLLRPVSLKGCMMVGWDELDMSKYKYRLPTNTMIRLGANDIWTVCSHHESTLYIRKSTVDGFVYDSINVDHRTKLNVMFFGADIKEAGSKEVGQ